MSEPVLCGECPDSRDAGTGLFCKGYGYTKDYSDHCDDCECDQCGGI